MKNLLLALVQNYLVFVSSSEVSEFVRFCNARGIYPSGGALEDGGQFLYL